MFRSLIHFGLFVYDVEWGLSFIVFLYGCLLQDVWKRWSLFIELLWYIFKESTDHKYVV